MPVEWYFDGDSLNAHYMLGAQENKFQEHSCKNTGSRAGFLGQSKENSFTRLELSRIPKKNCDEIVASDFSLVYRLGSDVSIWGLGNTEFHFFYSFIFMSTDGRCCL